MDKHLATSILLQAGLPNFPLTEQGFPQPGSVVKYYRTKMTYTDAKGKERHWSQAYLARKLQIRELAVRQMELKNEGLDSIQRRELLAQILSIPPVLLGLATLNHLEEDLTSSDEKKSSPTMIDDDVTIYKDILPIFRSAYEQSDLGGKHIDVWIARILHAIQHVRGNTKRELQHVMWEYHILSARMYYHDVIDLHAASNHLNAASEIAYTVGSKTLQAVTRYYNAEMYLEQGQSMLAQDILNLALTQADSISPQIRGRLLTYAALAHAQSAIDLADRKQVYRYLNEAELCSSYTGTSDIISFGRSRYIEDSADTFLTLNQPGKALEALDDLDDYDHKNRHNEYLSILRAECYATIKRPRYEEAVALLEQVVEDNMMHPRIYRLRYVSKVHKLLTVTPYGKSQDVVELGQSLRFTQKGR